VLGASLSATNNGSEFTLSGGISIGPRVVHGPLLVFTPSVERQSSLTTMKLMLSSVI